MGSCGQADGMERKEWSLFKTTSWQPVSRIKWPDDIILGRAIMTLYIFVYKMVTILSRGSPNLSNSYSRDKNRCSPFHLD